MGAALSLYSISDDFPVVSLTEEQASVLGKAFWKLCELYQFTREQQAVLLGIKLNRERLLSLEKQKTIPVEPDKFSRVGHLLGIHKNLRVLFPHNRELVYQWMHIKRELFSGLSAMEFIAQEPVESFARLFTVRRALDQIRCG